MSNIRNDAMEGKQRSALHMIVLQHGARYAANQIDAT